MKETFYKLNREKLGEHPSRFREDAFEFFLDEGILEEVKEEEAETAIEAFQTGYKIPKEHWKKTTRPCNQDEPKPFLEGMTPSEWLREGYENYPMLDRTSGYALRSLVGRMFDLLVKELKNRNVIK